MNTTLDQPTTEKELSSLFKIDRAVLRTLRTSGKIPYIKVGRRLLYVPKKVMEALEVKPFELVEA